MAYNEVWKRIMLEDLARQGYKSRSQAQSVANVQDVTGGTRSGQFAGASESIARAEGAQAAGINEIAAEMQRADAEERRRYEQNRKDAQDAQNSALKWGVAGNLASVFAPPLVSKGIDLLTKKNQQPAGPAVNVNSQMAQQVNPVTALERIRQGGTEQDPIYDLLVKAGLAMKKKPAGYLQTQNPYLYGNWNFPRGAATYSGGY